MAFTIPTFNLMCNVFTVVAGVPTLRDTIPCNMASGRRVSQLFGAAEEDGELYGVVPLLLVPMGSDVRDTSCGAEADLIEAPAGTGRWYMVTCVDDMAKGFSNEYRIVSVGKIWGFSGSGIPSLPPWPTPIP